MVSNRNIFNKLTHKELKYIRKLKYKKYRKLHKAYLAEGRKLIDTLIQGGARCKLLIIEENYFKGNTFHYVKSIPKIVVCPEQYLEQASTQKSVPSMIGVFSIQEKEFCQEKIQQSLSFLYEDMQDAGNMGTILRTAEWFGIGHIFCSENCVDLYSPKVVQASMGALVGVNVHYVNLEKLIERFKNPEFQIYGTFLTGENAFNIAFPQKGFIVFGNEGHGISKTLEKLICKKISIPPFNSSYHLDSLNIAMATTVVCTLLKVSPR